VYSHSNVKLPKYYGAGLHCGQSGKGRLDVGLLGLGDLPAPWQQFVHPDGKPYFRHPKWRLLTEANIRDPDQCAAIHSLHSRISSWEDKISFPDHAKPSEQTELYVVLNPSDARKGSYYCVDHDGREVFWLEDMVLEDIMPVGVPRHSSFELSILRNYYRHLENFPCHNKLPDDAAEFLRKALTYACTDHMTARESATSPWNAEDCKTFLDLLDVLENDEKGVTFDDDGYKTWFVARLVCIILHSRSVHRFGMHDAVTDRLATARRSQIGLIDILAGGLSFWAHHAYVSRLENVWAGGVVSVGGWGSLVTSLVIEWSDSNLLATVILSANMAFISLSQVHAVERASSLISTFLALGSIVIGLHHVWRHRVKKDTSAGQAGIYFQNATLRSGSMKPLAFFLSLPLILLSWSVLTFACSVSVYTFYGRQPRASFVITGVVFGTVVIIVLATVSFFWEIFVHRPMRAR